MLSWSDKESVQIHVLAIIHLSGVQLRILLSKDVQALAQTANKYGLMRRQCHHAVNEQQGYYFR